MASSFPSYPSYPEAPAPRDRNQLNSTPPVLPRKRSPSDLYYSSYGETEGTPTHNPRKTRRPNSRPGFCSDPSSPTFYSTPPSAQVPRQSSMEESGDESDDVYDEFDLGDFTKEEIKRYESMVGPGEGLRDAAPPKEPLSPAPETTSINHEDLGTSVTEKLPQELHAMLGAGLANAISRIDWGGGGGGSDITLPMRGFHYDCNSENEIDQVAGAFMEELAKPAPQMERFVRHNELRKKLCDYRESDCLEKLRDCYGPKISTKLAQRIFEQEVYDFGRSIGLTKKQSTGHVIKAREGSSKCGIDLPDFCDYESSECAEILNYLRTYPEPDLLPSNQKPNGHVQLSEDETDKVGELFAESNLQDAKQHQHRQGQKSIDSGRCYGYDEIRVAMFILQHVANKSLNRDDVSLHEVINGLEAVVKEKEKKAAKADTSKLKWKAEKDERRQAKKSKSREEKNDPTDKPEGQVKMRTISEKLPQLEDREKPLQPKKKGRKRKRKDEHEVQGGAFFDEHHKHKKGSMGGDAVFKKVKKKKDLGPQHSPFFERSSGPKTKEKDTSKKTEQQTDFPPPMIQ